MSPPDDLPATETSGCYLLVVQGGSSSIFPLADTGVVLIGRDEQADLRIDDEAISRSHARIITVAGAVRLHDLDSHNGSFVNGERAEGTHDLVSGDIITLGAATLIVHAGRPAQPPRAVLDAGTLRRRLVEELERATRYQRPVALLFIALPKSGETREHASAVVAELRLIDIVGFIGEAQLAVLLPETSDGRPFAERLARIVAGARVGLSHCPDDGVDADTLLSVAQAAAQAARPGEVGAPAAAERELRLGDRSLVLADPAVVRIFDLIARLATSDLPVLILGETGVGKEGAARAVHYGSRRKDGPFVTVNCAAIPDNLVESELFGYEKGAFTGAVAAKPGKLEAAHGGTLFLDEIGELPLTVQAKLLRAFEEKVVTRLGDVRERAVDLRIVAATNRALDDEVKEGRFRQDLYFRLGAATVVLPPLRDRPREIPILARRFLAQAHAQRGGEPPTLSPAAMERLCSYAWPGNVRELRNAMQYVAATVDDETVGVWHLPETIAGVSVEARAEEEAAAPDEPPPAAGFRAIGDEVRDLEKRRMAEALEVAGGVQRRAAELIQMPLRTFVTKLKQYGISPRARR